MIELAIFLGLLLLGLCLMLVIGLKVQRRALDAALASGAQYGRTVQLIQDKHELHRFGIAQYLKRQYGGISAFHASFSTLGLLATTVILIVPVLMHGGIQFVLLCFPILGILFIINSAALAELSSIQPTSGGLFHIALRYGGRLLAGLVAPLQVIGQLAMTILYSYCCALMCIIWLSPVIPLLQHPFAKVVMMGFIILLQVCISCCRSSIIKWVQIVGFWIQLLGILLLIGCVVYILYPLNYSPLYIMSFDSIWQSPLLTNQAVTPSSMGLVIVLLCKWFVGTEQAANISEETIDPKLRTPWSLFLASSYQFIFGFIFIFMISFFCIYVYTGSPSGSIHHWLSILLQASHIWGQIFIVIAIAACWMSGQSTLSNASRTLFALARDRLIPFSSKLATISYTRQTPQFAVIAAGMLSLALLALFVWFGEEQWIEQISMLIVLVYAGSCLLTIYFTKEQIKEAGAWHLGSWSNICKWISVLFLLILLSIASYCIAMSLLIGIVALMLLSIMYIFLFSNAKHVSMVSSEHIKLVEGKLPLH